ncbi:dTMP kinase [Thermosipho atlanticus]|uniref:Thymidylate kinase n=1 Tax=Thermosipho atlanticus DSM 15807 TaxID=1123380 RepID=A0A1M5TIZ3_9BACT|nr:dTMP kinase [Thermosipho atlanticus]SHH50674.1 thymidylate kinase [Thermosipho atlanticus DSM 15807]
MFISFEGLDGCGKSTQLEMLFDYLRNLGKKVIKVREPGGTEIGEKIRSILLNKELDINERAELLLFLASRAQLVEEVIKPALRNGYFVLADRFADSSIAYQGGARNLGVETVEFLNRFATNNIFPNIVFFIDISVEVALKRINKKKKDRMEIEGRSFLEKVRDTYLKISNTKSNFVIINGERSVDEIFYDVRKVIDNYIISK